MIEKDVPNIDGMRPDLAKEYMMLGAMGLDDLVPKAYHSFFSANSPGGGIVKSAETFKDLVNSYGFGASFIRELK